MTNTLSAANDNEPRQVKVGERVYFAYSDNEGEWIASNEMQAFIECDLIGSSSIPDVDGYVAEFRSTAGNPIFTALVVDEVDQQGEASAWHVEHYRTYEHADRARFRKKPVEVYDPDIEEYDDEFPDPIGTYERLVRESVG